MSQTYTGFHAIEEHIRRSTAQGTARLLCLRFCTPGPRAKKIIALARDCKVQCVQSTQQELDGLVAALPEQARDHRGLVLVSEQTAPRSTQDVQLDQWLAVPRERATVLMLDAVTDPHNVGAIMRSCDQFAVDLLITAERRAVQDIQGNEVIARSSAGASTYIPHATVPNLVRAASALKQAGFWIYGADSRGTSLYAFDFAPKSCIIMGSEGSGISRLLSQQCDQTVSIPTQGHIDSLNVSVAAGIILYERGRSLSKSQH